MSASCTRARREDFFARRGVVVFPRGSGGFGVVVVGVVVLFRGFESRHWESTVASSNHAVSCEFWLLVWTDWACLVTIAALATAVNPPQPVS